MQTSTAFAPSPKPEFGPALQSDNFAAFLARLAELPDWNSDPAVEPTYPSPELAGEGEEDLASLSYEQALRVPAQKGNKAQPPRPAAAQTALAVPPSPKVPEPPRALEVYKPFEISEPRHARTTVRFTAGENKLLHKRAAESGIAVSAYVRSCVLEVEALRAQISQLQAGLLQPSQPVAELPAPVAPRPAYSVVEQQLSGPTVPPPQPALPAPPPPRQPLTARTPAPTSAFRLDPRVQAAFDAQKRLSAESPSRFTEPTRPEKKRSFFSLLFGRRSA